MNPISSDQLLEQLRWRYACKQFDNTRRIDDATWSSLEEALVLSPSSFGLQPWKFYVITNQEIKDQLVEHSWNQMQVSNCSHLVVLTVRKQMEEAELDRFIHAISETQGRSEEELKGYKGMMSGFLGRMSEEQIIEWAKLQSYIALGQLMVSAALLGVDACPMEGFLAPKYDEVLSLAEEGYTSAVVCPLGYRSPEDKYASLPKVRYPVDEMVVRVS